MISRPNWVGIERTSSTGGADLLPPARTWKRSGIVSRGLIGTIIGVLVIIILVIVIMNLI